MNALSKKHKINSAGKADFIVDDKYIFEIGVKNKKKDQIANQENAFIVSDDIELNFQNKIPLWLFGLLY